MNELEVALQAIEAGASLLVGDTPSKPAGYGRVTAKALSDYQTDLDVEVENRITEVIRLHFPAHGIYGEELLAEAPETDCIWYVDPIDGTRNFVSGRPDIAVSVALYQGGRPVLGVISLPCRGLQLAAQAGIPGLLLNDRRVNPVFPDPGLEGALVGVPGDVRKERHLARLKEIVGGLVDTVEGFRVSGALAYDLASMALGEMDARFSLSPKAVDCAAGVFLVSHLGGTVTDMNGRPWSPASPDLLATMSPALHQRILPLIRVGGAPLEAD